MRCFIAVPMPEPVISAIRPLLGKLARSGADVTWVPPENIHLTLKFLGETDEASLSRLKAALEKKVASCRPFCITIAGVGYFPSEKRPRVVWIGCGNGAADGLHRAVEAAAAEAGFAPEERPFSAHLTIGRVRSPKRLQEAARVLDGYSGTVFGTAVISEVHIMKSDLKPAGAVYQSLSGIPLAKEDA
ncbi:MAG: RNA 2',3'-cyclic phosphodiesterase [Thermodesulfovibrionales bacterium]